MKGLILAILVVVMMLAAVPLASASHGNPADHIPQALALRDAGLSEARLSDIVGIEAAEAIRPIVAEALYAVDPARQPQVWALQEAGFSTEAIRAIVDIQ